MVDLPPKAWICAVCGYIHYGPEPPEECPVCGSLKDMFEPYNETPAVPAAPAPTQWRCQECGYILEGSEPPEFCPSCGAPADQFERLAAEENVLPVSNDAVKIVIVGAGIAGVSAAESARKNAPNAEITLISNETNLPYYRLNLTRYLANEINSGQLDLYPESWYAENRINLLRDCELQHIDLDKKEIALQDERQIPFDRLILTIGSHPFLPPIPGANRKNVTTLRTRKDSDAILETCRGIKKCVCIGGGLLGLEAAGAIARQGIDVTVLENQAWLLPRQLNELAGKLLQEKVHSTGITIRTGSKIRELVGEESVQGVLLEDGTLLPAGLVIISAGIRSNVELARQAGLKVNQGIVVDSHMNTSHPDVFAAGDAAEYQGIVYGIWGPSQIQGSIAGTNVVGQRAEFKGLPRSNTLKVLGIHLFSVGQISPKDPGDKMIDMELDGNYCCFIFHEQHLVGAILLGDTSLSSKVKMAVENQTDFSDMLSKNPDGKEVLAYLAAK
jgi:nitrite reductase (NADH) large subunit